MAVAKQKRKRNDDTSSCCILGLAPSDRREVRLLYNDCVPLLADRCAIAKLHPMEKANGAGIHGLRVDIMAKITLNGEGSSHH
jgi:hypothetical protein